LSRKDKQPEEFLAGDFDHMLVNGCIPYIKSNYRADRELAAAKWRGFRWDPAMRG